MIGKAKEKVGELTGNREEQGKGKVQETKGKGQQTVSKAKEKVKKAA